MKSAIAQRPSRESPGKLDFLAGTGEMADRIRSFDWKKTPLGSPASWSPALQTTLRIMLANRFPHILWWGPQYIQFYNDSYRPIPGTKHPNLALGRPASECWKEIWHVIGPLVDRPFKGGPATWDDDIFLEVNRHGFVEETHFTIAYSPVPDETVPGGIGGVLATVHEITSKVIGERRIVALRDLGATAAEAKTAEEACAIAASTLARHGKDIPFVLLYLLDNCAKQARLAGAAGVGFGTEISPASVDLNDAQSSVWPLAHTLQAGTMQVIRDLGARLTSVPSGPWSDPPNTAVVMTIPSNKANEPAGLMVAGVSARLNLDQFYTDFFDLVRAQIATAIANARAYEEERKRAEALAELDRAKTAFFSNVSHEFRTPLTLMLGPLEDALADAHGVLPKGAAADLQVAHRNSLRLLKLVNTLLDFSRIEAGRIDASYEPTDLADLTANLAGVFRSAIENAGLRLTVDCPKLPELAYVDREMWEKIVLNLLSNAFKFTFEGEINVSLRWCGERIELSVSDTGVGIPEPELSKIFDRFHRVQNTRSRTHEGTGIGLALVQQLSALHGGQVTAQSKEGKGTAFVVSIQAGSAHLPPEHIRAPRWQSSTETGAASFVEEALRWLPGVSETSELIRSEGKSSTEPSVAGSAPSNAACIVIADDNADMREYLARLLENQFKVQAVGNGEAALRLIQETPPDLVLADVMMPRLDGFGLLRALRADQRTRAIPIILLSARAGEESRVEGLHQGADDYLIKPFRARELVARVAAHLQLARARKDAEHALAKAGQRAVNILESITDGFYLTNAAGRFIEFNSAARRMFAEQGVDADSLLGKHIFDEVFPEARDDPVGRAIQRTLTERVFTEAENFYPPWQRWYSVRNFPIPEGGVATFFRDVTNSKLAEHNLRESEERFRKTNSELQRRVRELETANSEIQKARRAALNLMQDSVESRRALERLNAELRESEERFRMMADNISQLAWTCDKLGNVTWYNQRWLDYTGLTFEEMRDWGWTKVHHPDHVERVVASVKRSRESGKVWQDTFPLRGKDGEYRWFLSRALPIRDVDGNIIRWFGTNTDVTEQRDSEEALRRAHELVTDEAAHLEVLVQERTARLKETIGELEHFSYTITHDMRAPLRAMQGFGAMLLSESGDSLSPKSADYLRRIMDAASRMDALIRDSLQYAKIVRGMIPLISVEPIPILRGILESYLSLQPPQVEIQIVEPLPAVIANEAGLAQCFSNLLVNAVKFVKPGVKPRIRIWAEDVGRAVASRPSTPLSSEVVRFWFEDNGIGIPQEYQDRIFGMFQQLDKSYEGTGIGLALVRKTSERMGGNVGVESEYGKGSRFWLEFKKADPPNK